MAIWDAAGTRQHELPLGEAEQAAEVRRTVRRVRGYWSRAGVPWAERRRKAEELRTHLEAVLADGRRARDVVGDDVAAFAAAWVQADRRRPWLEPVLGLLAAATVVPGAFALLGPRVLDQDRTGIPLEHVALLGAILPLVLGLHLLRTFRDRLDTQRAAIAGVLLFVVYVAAWMILVPRADDADRLVIIAPAVAWTMVAVGGAIQTSASWLERTGRL